MAERNDSKTQVVTPAEMETFTERLKTGRPAARKKKAKKKVRSGTVRSGRTDDPRQVSLPGLSEFMLAMPNDVARSSLFAPVTRGKRRVLVRQVMETRGDARMVFSGEQLDESDSDVWMLLMKMAANYEPGAIFEVHRREFLQKLNRSVGGSMYEWLHRSLQRLDWGQLSMEGNTGGKPWKVGITLFLHPIKELSFNASRGVYTLCIDERWRFIYGGNQFSLIDWDKRMLFGKNQDMAKSLQRLIAASSDSLQRYQVEWLKKRMLSTGRLRDFRTALQAAFVELERVGVIRDGKVVGEVASWRRVR